MRIGNLAGWAIASLVAWSGIAAAQAPVDVLLSPEVMRSLSTRARDLAYPESPSTFGMFHAPQMALYKPEGAGPFPALVLLHQCGGLRAASGRWQNQSMLEWARRAVERGYVVLQVDALGPRGVDTVCMGPKGDVYFQRGVRDVLLAAEHLARQPFVDDKRIAMAGYSWGAAVALEVASRYWRDGAQSSGRIAAVASFYPPCWRIDRPNTRYDLVATDIDIPALTLMGARDTETPASECVARLESAKGRGAPVEWHIYPEATHCFDCVNLDGFSKVDVRGSRVEYRYGKADTEDAARRMFEFFAARLGKGG